MLLVTTIPLLVSVHSDPTQLVSLTPLMAQTLFSQTLLVTTTPLLVIVLSIAIQLAAQMWPLVVTLFTPIRLVISTRLLVTLIPLMATHHFTQILPAPLTLLLVTRPVATSLMVHQLQVLLTIQSSLVQTPRLSLIMTRIQL